MLIGQSVLAPTTPGAIYYTPWFPRQGNAFRAVLEVLFFSGTMTLSCSVETKNEEDTDVSPTVLATFSATTIGIASENCTGAVHHQEVGLRGSNS